MDLTVSVVIGVLGANSSCDCASAFETKFAKKLVELALLDGVAWPTMHVHLSLTHLNVLTVANLVWTTHLVTW